MNLDLIMVCSVDVILTCCIDASVGMTFYYMVCHLRRDSGEQLFSTLLFLWLIIADIIDLLVEQFIFPM